MGDKCVVNGIGGVCVVFGWLAAVGCVVGLGGAGLPFVLNLFLLMSRSCLSCWMRRYCGVVGVMGVGSLWVGCGGAVGVLGGNSSRAVTGLSHGVSSCVWFAASAAVGVFGGVGDGGIAGSAQSEPFGVRRWVRGLNGAGLSGRGVVFVFGGGCVCGRVVISVVGCLLRVRFIRSFARSGFPHCVYAVVQPSSTGCLACLAVRCLRAGIIVVVTSGSNCLPVLSPGLPVLRYAFELFK